MRNLPGPLREIVNTLTDLPGFGPKSALRAAMTFLHWPKERVVTFGENIKRLREELCVCRSCRALTENELCSICSDPARNNEELLLVAEWDSLLTIEEAAFYRGRYFVLGGLLAPLDGIDPRSLEFDCLRQRLNENMVKEVILGLGATLDAEATASYIKNLLAEEYPSIHLSRLAQGIPLGGEVKYMDKETLAQSMTYRQKI